MPTDLRSITDFEELLAYLGDELDWPVQDYPLEDLVFEYDADELGLKEEEAEKLKDGSIRQLRPMPGGQPFGIFFVEFGQAKLPVVVLRRILNALVIKKRNSANPADRQRWDAADLLFISAFGEDDDREIAFAHFHKDPETSELPVLRVLGWDGADTTLKTQYVAETLKNRLHWPENAEDHDAWRTQWRGAFRHRLGHVIKTASDLADALAGFARKIRDAATTIMEHESEAKGQLRKLHRAFQSGLISDLSEEDFADTYAQTVTYGLLTAAISRTEMSEGRHGTALTQEDITAMVPVTNPFLKEMLQEFLKVGGRKGGVDFDELGINEVVELLRGDETDLPAILRDFGNRKPGEDPVIHFYENFLASYNKQLRIQRGVFYTPQSVVGYIVRSVHELLQTEFGLEDGLASTATWGEMLEAHPDLKLPPLTDEPGCKDTISSDEPFVQILDPATGTATFLVEVIDVIYRQLGKKWKQQGLSTAAQKEAWNEYVPNHLLPRLHGYELMMAPYAIAHMKIGLKLAETGYRFGTEERARIYLTNALEPWVKEPMLPDFDALAHEAQAVNEIKRHKLFTVVIGNPPYSISSQNKSKFIELLMELYKVDVRHEPNIKPLSDDYVKFYRFAHSLAVKVPFAVVGLITNNSFLWGPTFLGMRKCLMADFAPIYFTNLHGDSLSGETNPYEEKDENVFDIRQGVVISILIRSPQSGKEAVAMSDDLYGSRESKYRALANRSGRTTEWNMIPHKTPGSPFLITDMTNEAEYQSFPSLTTVLQIHSKPILTKRDHITIHIDRESLLNTLDDLIQLSHSDFETKYCLQPDSRDWSYASAKNAVASFGIKDPFIQRVNYRPLDKRWTYYVDKSKGFMAYPVFGLLRHMLKPNLGLCIPRQVNNLPWRHALVVNGITEYCYISNRTREQNDVFTLYSYEEASEQDVLDFTGLRKPNFSSTFLKLLSTTLNLSQTGAHGLPAGLTPEEIFHYVYGVFHSPIYRSRFAEFLKVDFPRLPLTQNLKLFRAMASLGAELSALHLLESPTLDEPITEFVGNIRQATKIGWTPDDGGTVWLDGGGTKATPQPGTCGFRPVPEEVWNFRIGGYQVCEKWLKDRQAKGGQNPRPGRTLTDEDIAHYHKIVIALTETIRLMAEIDEVIEAHGGWPDAFQTEKAAED